MDKKRKLRFNRLRKAKRVSAILTRFFNYAKEIGAIPNSGERHICNCGGKCGNNCKCRGE